MYSLYIARFCFYVTFYLGRAAYAVKLLSAERVVLKPFKKLELKVKSSDIKQTSSIVRAVILLVFFSAI